MHKGRHYRSFMKLKLYTNPSNRCFITDFKSVGQETWSASFPSNHFAVFEYFIRWITSVSHDYAKKHLVGAINTSERCACHRLRSLPSTLITAKQDKGMRKRNCLSTIAEMVEMQQYKDNDEERNCSSLIKILLPPLPDVHGEPPKRNARTGPSQGSRKSVTLETAAKHLKETYDFNETEQQRQKVRIYVTQTQHKRNKAPLNCGCLYSTCSWRDKFSFANVQVMFIKILYDFAVDSHWVKCTKPSRIEEEKRTEEFAQGMPRPQG